ncbi:hypothetical protein NKH18_06030 [Streptomyces sp. M10(2022)]
MRLFQYQARTAYGVWLDSMAEFATSAFQVAGVRCPVSGPSAMQGPALAPSPYNRRLASAADARD